MKDWISDTVRPGLKGGRTIGFPTINLDPRKPGPIREGVYACLVRYGGEEYTGALYYGPRLVNNETRPVLEIYILDFSRDIYGETVEYRIGGFVRGVMDFASLAELKSQIGTDVEAVRKAVYREVPRQDGSGD